MPIKDYSTTAANNALTPPNGAPEGMAAGLVNNTMRQMMADTRLFYESGGWCDLGHVPTFVSTTSFTIPTDVTAFYTAGRRIRMFGTIMGTFYGYIVSSAYSAPNTTITVILDSGALTSNLSRVDLSFFEQLTTGINAQGIVGRNKIINGRMDIAQRGTSFPAMAASTYCLDRYALQYTTTGVVTVSQQQDAPSDNEFQNSLRVTVTTADTSIASADFMYLRQSIEGINVRDLIGKPFTLSFRVRSSKTGVHCVAFRNAGFDRAFIAEYTINNANTWETKSITVSPGLITSGTWNWSNGIGLDVEFILMAGSLFHTTTGSWLSSSAALCTSNQVNFLDTVGNIFAVTGIQLEPGIVATPFEHRLFGQELIYARRYTRIQSFPIPVTGSTAYGYIIDMRAIPTITGGGSGFNSGGTTSDILTCTQTTPSGGTVLTLNAEL